MGFIHGSLLTSAMGCLAKQLSSISVLFMNHKWTLIDVLPLLHLVWALGLRLMKKETS